MGLSRPLRDRRLQALAILALAALVLLSGLGSHGFWEPHEIEVADRARLALEARQAGEEPDHDRSDGPPLTDWLIGQGIAWFGLSELGARLPLALLGLLAVIVTLACGRRLASWRAGVLAALALLSSPLFLLQARHLTSNIGTLTGSALIVFGFVGLATRERPGGRAILFDALDGLAIAAGAALAYHAGGALLGLMVPLGAFAGAGATFLFAGPGEPDRGRRGTLLFVTGLAAACALAAGLHLALGLFELVEAYPGDRAIFGKKLAPVKGYVSALGGSWLLEGDLRVKFNALFEEIAFGMFPWSAVAPIALGWLVAERKRGREALAGYLLFAWALFGWAAATLMARKVGPVHYPAAVALALACGVWADAVLSTRRRAAEKVAGEGEEKRGEQGEEEREGGAVWPLVGLFVFLASLVLAKDLTAFPDKLTSLNLPGTVVKYPEEVRLHRAIPVFGALFGAAMLWALALRRPSGRGWKKLVSLLHRAHRHVSAGVLLAAGAGVLFSAFLVFAWSPELARKLSSKHVFSVYKDLRRPGEALGILGVTGSGPDYYAGDYRELKNRGELLTFLGSPERVFALTRASELCPVHKAAATGDFTYHVLDDSHARFLLLSNQLGEGEVDQNPLARAILRERPRDIKIPLAVNFDDRIELIGADMPASVERGDRFEMTLYFEVKKRIRRNWKIFVHFDGGGMRFQGDHDPIQGRCGTNFWQPGDFIVDTFEVVAGGVTYPKTNYRVWAGFFVGSHGNWTNMEVKSGQADENNRIPVGSLEVR